MFCILYNFRHSSTENIVKSFCTQKGLRHKIWPKPFLPKDILTPPGQADIRDPL